MSFQLVSLFKMTPFILSLTQIISSFKTTICYYDIINFSFSFILDALNRNVTIIITINIYFIFLIAPTEWLKVKEWKKKNDIYSMVVRRRRRKNERVIGIFFWPEFHPKVSFGTSWPYFPRVHLDMSVRLTCSTAYYANLFSFHLFLINRYCFSITITIIIKSIYSKSFVNNY